MHPSATWAGPRPDPELESVELIEDVLDLHRQHVGDLARGLALARRLAKEPRRPEAPAAGALAVALAAFLAELRAHQRREAKLLADRERIAGHDLFGALVQLGVEHELVRDHLARLKLLAVGVQGAEGSEIAALIARYDADLDEDLRLEERVLFPRLAAACAGATSPASAPPIDDRGPAISSAPRGR